jgi:hypothetical protein
MPLYRHDCACGFESVDLLAVGEGNPDHCGATMRRLPPRRVVGRVRGDSNGAHQGSGFAAPIVGHEEQWTGDGDEPGSMRPQQKQVSKLRDPDDPTAVKQPNRTGAWVKDYGECTAAERDERWRDTAAAVADWTTRGLESKGEAPAVARATAATAATATIVKARAESTVAGAPS